MDDLFKNAGLAEYLAGKTREMIGAIDDIFLTSSVQRDPQEITDSMADGRAIETLRIDGSKITCEKCLKLIDRAPEGSTPGLGVTYLIPVTGDTELLKYGADPRSVPLGRAPEIAAIEGGTIRLNYTLPSADVSKFKSELERDLDFIKASLDWINNRVAKHNDSLLDAAHQRVAIWIDLTKDRDWDAELGCPSRG